MQRRRVKLMLNFVKVGGTAATSVPAVSGPLLSYNKSKAFAHEIYLLRTVLLWYITSQTPYHEFETSISFTTYNIV